MFVNKRFAEVVIANCREGDINNPSFSFLCRSLGERLSVPAFLLVDRKLTKAPIGFTPHVAFPSSDASESPYADPTTCTRFRWLPNCEFNAPVR